MSWLVTVSITLNHNDELARHSIDYFERIDDLDRHSREYFETMMNFQTQQ